MFIGWLSRQPNKNGRRASPFTHGHIEKYGEYVKYMRSIKNDVHVILDACISQQNHSWFYHVLSCSTHSSLDPSSLAQSCPVAARHPVAKISLSYLDVGFCGLKANVQRLNWWKTMWIHDSNIFQWWFWIHFGFSFLDVLFEVDFGDDFGVAHEFRIHWRRQWKNSRFRAALGGDHRCPLRFPCEVLVQRNP